jgi:two-component system CheB/CheR fusion protein
MKSDISNVAQGARLKSAWLRPYVAALVLVLVAWLVQSTFGPEFGEVFAFLPFVVASVFTSLLGGFRPTILATLCGFVIVSWFYVTPGTLFISGKDHVVALGFYVGLSVTTGWLAESLHTTRRKAEALARSLQADIIQRERTEEALRNADLRKNEFLAMLAHELRNPLAAIQYAADFAELGGNSQNDFDWSEVIGRQVKHLARLVDDLLDVSRITQGKISLHQELVDASVLIRRAAEALRPAIDEKQLMLTIDVPVNCLPLQVDRTRIEQVFQNLLDNAIKYTEPRGRITVIGRPDREEAVFTIKDSGIGMLAELVPHVFDLFTQGDRTPDRAYGGLGIGLTLVRQITEMHGGSVSAASDGLGRGSTFTIRLPRQEQRGTKPGEFPDAQSVAADSKRVLIVDDNVDGALTLGLLLESAGHEVAVCHTGMGAVAAAQAFLPDVVLLDIGLPGKDGFQVARELRADNKLCRSVIVGLSGYGQDADRDRSRAAGFDEHLVKPIDFKFLRAAIGTCARNSQ